MLNETYCGMLDHKSVIRETFMYGKQRAAQIGYENVFDYSLGNPSVPCPEQFTAAMQELLAQEDPVGWTAPSVAMVMQGPWKLDLVSGKSILIPNATLLSNLGGKLTLTETAKIECTLEVAMPEDGSQPYGVFDTESIPSEWEQYKLPAAEEAAAQIQTGEG